MSPLQEGEPVGSSFLQLVVTDGDTPRNGPPFSFHIVSGNEDHRFHVDQGGLLSLSAPLKKRVKPRHQLKIQVHLYVSGQGRIRPCSLFCDTFTACLWNKSSLCDRS